MSRYIDLFAFREIRDLLGYKKKKKSYYTHVIFITRNTMKCSLVDQGYKTGSCLISAKGIQKKAKDISPTSVVVKI